MKLIFIIKLIVFQGPIVFKNIKIILPLLFLSLNIQAVPIDWHGTFGVDTTLIDNYRKIDKTVDASAVGSAEVPLAAGGHANASFQSYVFHLDPTLVINDATSIKGELTSGYGRGGRLGDNSSQSQNVNFGNALYSQNFNKSNSNSGFEVSKIYMELYSDTATWLIGRHTYNWGLGAVINSGEDVWDRHSYIRDGFTMKVKLGNFNIHPFWSKVGSEDSLTRATNMKEYGVSLLYDNPDRDLVFGLLYSIKKANASNNTITSNVNGTGASSLGKSNVKLVDLYFTKTLGDFDFSLEAPIFSGELGFLYNTQTQAKYKARAIIAEAKYNHSDTLKFGLDVGKVSGDSGQLSSFEAMFLNPNYQIANLMFRYNMLAVSQPGAFNVYDSYISNVQYLKAYMNYLANKWTWNFAMIYATAQETAKAGTLSYDHLRNQNFNATHSQADDLGFEIDVDFVYQWNREVTVGGALGYYFVGDYYAYNNTAIPNVTSNSYSFQLNVGVGF
jgi:hypothetical protein